MTDIKFAVLLFAGLATAAAADQAPIFHGIKLGVSLGSQFKGCPWNPPKEGDIPEFIYSPYKDEKGNTIPCFHHWELIPFAPESYPRLENVWLFDHAIRLKDDKGQSQSLWSQPLPTMPVVWVTVLVPASTQLTDGTIEGVTLKYLPDEADRIKEALVTKFGPSQIPDGKKGDPKVIELFGVKRREFWNTDWGELHLSVTDKDVFVGAKTSKLIKLERDKEQNKPDEF